MSLGLIGRKCGMTRIFEEDGSSVPVTVLAVEPNRIVQIKNHEEGKGQSVQVTTGKRRHSRVTKPLAKHYAKANVEAGRGLWEFKLTDIDEALKVGGEINVDIFENGQYVDVAGTSKGKGWSGAIKRHNFSSQRMSHGNSLSHRAPGSIGQNQTPGRVFKGKRMAGQYGNKRCTIQNLKIVRVDSDRNLLLVKGAVPGAKGGNVIVKPAVKRG
ncbi:MAG: 50S ribosomal protein L3 [Pseudomonadota bacterium]